MTQLTRRYIYETLRHISASKVNDTETFEDFLRKMKIITVIEI